MRSITVTQVASGFIFKVEPDMDAYRRQIEEVRMATAIAQEREREKALRESVGRGGWGGGAPAQPMPAQPMTAPCPIPYPPEPVAEVHAFSTIKEAAAFLTGMFTPSSVFAPAKQAHEPIYNDDDTPVPIADTPVPIADTMAAPSTKRKLGE